MAGRVEFEPVTCHDPRCPYKEWAHGRRKRRPTAPVTTTTKLDAAELDATVESLTAYLRDYQAVGG